MFTIAFLIGIFSYTLLFLGLTGLLYWQTVNSIFLIFLLIFFAILLKNSKDIKVKNIFSSKLSKVVIALLGIQLIINLVGALGPELAFDALWYHLTIPKIFLEQHKIFFIPGNLLYYSELPKLTEMLYLA